MLVATNHLQRISGSEVVALEAIEHFRAAGCDVTVFANWIGAPMRRVVEKAAGRAIITDPAAIRPFTYDIAYVQHQVLGLLDYEAGPDDVEATMIAIGRLSRRAFLESGGWLHDRLLANLVLANSELTAQHLKDVGGEGRVVSFHNGAPDTFFAPYRPRPSRPGRIIAVTNHRDPALLAALDGLADHAKVHHFGRSGEKVRRMTPHIIAKADLVISIGKTVPYALAGRIPVYVYDHFGGPGYLTPENRDRAALFNFTGRCSERKLAGRELIDDILGGYRIGNDFARDVPDAWLRRYRLSDHLDRMFEPPLVSNAEKRARMKASPFLAQERMLSDYVRASYQREQRVEAKRR
ncbi:hypothetical protein ASG17_07835 [Brevundimonas sp. Leaf363]|nr:hypothetical protein ASG17_07835 [Brevundimonas sp. Leaf363]